MSEPKKIPLCPYCKSSSVTFDTITVWNVERQDWDHNDYLDSGNCLDCGETLKNFEWETLNEAPESEEVHGAPL